MTDLLSALGGPILIIMVFNIFPIIFFFVLRNNKKQLGSPSVRKKYGQLYETIDV